MKPEQLRILIAVIETGSFSRAAKHVYKSQAAVSKAIKSLEDELALSLFSRDTYRPELTREGKAFYRKAIEVVNQFEQLEGFAKELSLGVEPELNVVVSALCPLPKILEIIKRLAAEYPQTCINLSINTLGRVLEKIKTGEADIAITPLEGSDSTLESTYLYDVKMLLVASSCSNLPTTSPCSSETLKTQPQIVVKNEHRQELDRSDDVLRGGRRWDVNGLLSKKELILAGLGWGQLPEHLVSEELKKGLLQQLDVEGFSLPRNPKVHLVRNQQHQPGPVAQKLWHYIICEQLN